MKATQVIAKMVEIKDNNNLNSDQSKYVNQVIEDFTEMGSMFEEDEDSMNEVKKFIAKFPNKPQGTPSRARGEAVMVKLAGKMQARTDRNRPGANVRLDMSRYSSNKKSLEIEGIILDKGDEIKDKSTGKTIIFDTFENRPEGIYILGSLKDGKPHEMHHDNAHSPKKKGATPHKGSTHKGKSAVAEAKAELAETKKEVQQEVQQAEKKAEKLLETADKQAEQGNSAQAKKTVEKAKEIVQEAVIEAKVQVQEAQKDVAQAQTASGANPVKKKKAKQVEQANDDKPKPVAPGNDKKEKEKARDAEKKAKAIKKGAYLDLGKDIIRIESIVKKDGKMMIAGVTRTGKIMEKTCTVESCKLTDFKAFNSQEDDFKGKQVAEMSEEQRILIAYLDISNKPNQKDAQNLMIRINKFATEYVAAHGKKTNPYRDEINEVADLLKNYLEGKKSLLIGSKENSITNILDKVEGERIYKTVSIVKRFAGWAKRTVSSESISDYIADIELSKKRKLIKPTDPLYEEVGQIEKILISMQSGGSYTFPDLGLGDVPMGLAGTRKMIKQWSKDAEKRAMAVIKKSPQHNNAQSYQNHSANSNKPTGFFSRIFGK